MCMILAGIYGFSPGIIFIEGGASNNGMMGMME